MTVTYSKLQSEKGFITNNFVIDDQGVLVVDTIDVQTFKIDGDTVLSSGNSYNIFGTTLPSEIVNSSLTSLGTLTGLTVQGNTSLTNGIITITSSTSGTMDNINIGSTTRGSGAFTTLSANNTVTLSPTSTVTISPTGSVTISPTGNISINPTGNITANPTGNISINPTGNISINPSTVGNINNVNIGNIVPRTGNFTSLSLTEEATLPTQVPTKKYIDRKLTAFTIAFGS